MVFLRHGDADDDDNQVNLELVCSLNIEQSRLLQNALRNKYVELTYYVFLHK